MWPLSRFSINIFVDLHCSIHSIGIGPRLTITTSDYYYYLGKRRLIIDWANHLGCNLKEETYPTMMDGTDEWMCFKWSSCR